MHSVIISRDSQFIRVFPLQAQTSIGRSPNNDIVLDAAGVSRTHAAIKQQENQFFLIDKGSTNGTYIEDKQVRHHLLTNGTSFRIQDYLLTFVEEVRTQDAPPDRMNTTTLIGSTPDKLVKTSVATQTVTREHGLQQKIFQLLEMVRNLISAPSDVDTKYLVLDALIDITGAKQGVVAMQQEHGDPVFTHIRGFDLQDQRASISKTIIQKVFSKGEVVYLGRSEGEDNIKSVGWVGPKSVLCIPLITGQQTIGCIYLDHPDQDGVFSKTDRELMVAASYFIGDAFSSDKFQSSNLDREDVRLSLDLEKQGIIALSPKTVKVFRDCKTIARYNVSVLIFGETGTGKEIIAHYIHNQSGRKGKFIARNCSAIAATMFESEVFGHEKGAFTGATGRKLGILELADQGTLFLDEIGDMPAELQAKVLRALQEQEVWRVGGSSPVKIDVRVIAATHKDLKANRKDLNFRDDLYYRLANVEITAPSLRERTEDIAPLCKMILERFNKEQLENRSPYSLSPKALRLLEAYDWPGNIRELRNTLIQASVKCDELVIDKRHLNGLIDVFAAPSSRIAGPLPSLAEVERIHILKVLKSTNWNKSAAAKVLSIDRNRLNRRLKKLGIDSHASK